MKIAIFVNESLYDSAIAKANKLKLRKIQSQIILLKKEHEQAKPGQEIIHKLLRNSLSDQRIYIIGDSLLDLQTALNCRGLAVIIPKSEWEELKIADRSTTRKHICSSFKQALDFIIKAES